MITMRAKYALKALGRLARARAEPVLIADIARAEGIPHKFLEQILGQLKQHGIVHSKKGRGGGYALGRDAASIRVGDVIRILDGPLAPVPCLSKTAYRRCDECKSEATCGVRLILKDAHEATTRILDTRTVADLARTTEHASAPLRYSI
jgi:Rrf2 family protein